MREVAADWFAAQSSIKPSTRTRYESLLRLHVLPAFGHRQVSSITVAQVEDWISALTASGLSASSVRHAHRVIALVLGRAVKDRLLGVNPAQGVDNRPSLPRSDKRFLTQEEVARPPRGGGRRPGPPHRARAGLLRPAVR